MFQFTHPGRGATKEAIRSLGVRSVSIHAPREGCDGVLLFLRATLRFQFTHPGRGATLSNCEGDTRRAVSIHAPREGCDYKHCLHSTYVQRFNSRTPGGVRRDFALSRMLSSLFQFTHPGRGATVSDAVAVYDYPVSIHAPREGCDITPMYVSAIFVVSIHAPREGCDITILSAKSLTLRVSIHAPREGCDGTLEIR